MSRRGRAWSAIAAGALAAAALTAMAVSDSRDPAPRYSLPLLLVVGFVAVGLLAAGVSQLVMEQRVAAGAPDEPVSYRHTVRLFAVLGVVLLVAVVARGMAIPADFGVRGHYRAGAPVDAARVYAPRYQGAASCLECHESEHADTGKDVHHSVQCETCHGPGDRHHDDPKVNHLTVDKTADGCLVCHRKIMGRPGSFPQVVPQEHFRLVGAKDGVACVSCHDPHQPIFLPRALAQARLHPLVHRCRDCHLDRTDKTLVRPAAHPAIFDCSYCHSKIAADFPERRHAAVACTTCHLFVRDSDFAGRIVRNTNPRFCLLCHGAADFRRDDAPATIDWDEHRKTFDDTLDETAPCTTCHADTVHGDLAAGSSK